MIWAFIALAALITLVLSAVIADDTGPMDAITVTIAFAISGIWFLMGYTYKWAHTNTNTKP